MNLPNGTPVPLPVWVGRLALLLVGSLLLVLFATAWSSKADKADVDALRYDMQRVLDLLCDGKPTARQCQ